jgi:hypothetical protein
MRDVAYIADVAVLPRWIRVSHDALLNDYFDQSRTILVTTHQVEEIQDVRSSPSTNVNCSGAASCWMVVLPVITFVLTIVTQLIMLLASTTYLSIHGRSAAALWHLPWLQMTSGMLYHLITVHSLYYAPIFGWLLLVSAWAKRQPFLWAFLSLAAIGVIGKIVFNTTHFATMLGSRISGGMEASDAKGGMMMLWPSHPLEFLTRPGLWIGLFIAGCASPPQCACDTTAIRSEVASSRPRTSVAYFVANGSRVSTGKTEK